MSDFQQFVDAPWYPGVELPLPGLTMMESFLPFSAEDEQRFWLIEGHWARGMTPLTVSASIDVLWGTQYGANLYQLPTTHGQAGRFAGVHGYVSDLACCSAWEIEHRATKVEGLVGPAIAAFPETWQTRLDGLIAGLDHFESADMAAMAVDELRTYVSEFWSFHRWAWEVHFELMDPLIGNYMAFSETCNEIGVSETDRAQFFQGRPTKVSETDRKLWELADAARGTPVEPLLDGVSATDGLSALRSSNQSAVTEWVGRLDHFLDEYGWRTEGMCDPALAPWIEDPTPVIAIVAGFVRAPRSHDFDASAAAALADREAAIERARSGLNDDQRAAFDAGLAANDHANFAWWQEEHNFYIDMRAHIPLRRAVLRLAEIVDAERFDDLIFLFRHEIDEVLVEPSAYEQYRGLVTERRAFFERSSAERDRMPGMLGAPPEGTDDPVLKEIFGVDSAMMESVANADADATEVTGIPAAAGVASGTARVITAVDELHELEPDEILVCGFTSPGWTPAFALIAGCVADTGGALSHTAIVSREYRIPAVVGTGVATSLIRSGDLIEIDGDRGRVTIIERAS